MSIEIHAFLGSDVLDLEARLVHRFSEAGFRIELHPESSLLKENALATLYAVILEAPSFLERIMPGQPLLVGFGYVPVAFDPNAEPLSGWPPSKVGPYSWELQTRTTAGRSQAAYFMQALTAAILASETRGHFYVAGDATAMTGKAGLAKIERELHSQTQSNEQIRKIVQSAKAGNKTEDMTFAAGLERRLIAAFDEGAYPFTAWPPLDPHVPYRWPAPIASPGRADRTIAPRREKKKILTGKVLYWTLAWGLVAAFTLVTLVYS